MVNVFLDLEEIFKYPIHSEYTKVGLIKDLLNDHEEDRDLIIPISLPPKEEIEGWMFYFSLLEEFPINFENIGDFLPGISGIFRAGDYILNLSPFEHIRKFFLNESCKSDELFGYYLYDNDLVFREWLKEKEFRLPGNLPNDEDYLIGYNELPTDVKDRLKNYEETLKFLRDKFEEMNDTRLNKFVVAGGFLAYSLLSKEAIEDVLSKDKDIDLFAAGISEEKVENILEEVDNLSKEQSKIALDALKLSEYGRYGVRFHKTNPSKGDYRIFFNFYTIDIHYYFSNSTHHDNWESNRIHFQIIKRIYTNISEIMLGFDLDASCVCYYSGKIYFTNRFIRAIRYGNLVDPDRQSDTYAKRLVKYVNYGYPVYIPNVDIYFNPSTQRTKIMDSILSTIKLPDRIPYVAKLLKDYGFTHQQIIKIYIIREHLSYGKDKYGIYNFIYAFDFIGLVADTPEELMKFLDSLPNFASLNDHEKNTQYIRTFFSNLENKNEMIIDYAENIVNIVATKINEGLESSSDRYSLESGELLERIIMFYDFPLSIYNYIPDVNKFAQAGNPTTSDYQDVDYESRKLFKWDGIKKFLGIPPIIPKSRPDIWITQDPGKQITSTFNPKDYPLYGL